ncbi:iron ABC transporter permease [Anaerococcus murdochii]|uniref:Iron ABC transporter permease n=1 Tax=Anaerococcus murdochii TaxID=411577 RepID=A0ABS7SWY9_9FIRM|nr:iron ABC transporter permease [Anaerococcus murdochii]MBZ2386032.1 iron ABC transporter permease [Anaerococcus murdochii]
MIKKLLIKERKFRPMGLFILIILPIIASLFGLSLGRMPLSPREILGFLLSFLKNEPYDPMLESVIINIRLPRILTGLVVGGGLAVAGLAFQLIFSNPLATPDILGVASSASLGAILGIVLSLGTFQIQILALATGLLGVFFVLKISKKDGRMSTIMLILSGLVISSLANAFGSLLKYMADPTDKLPAISYWLMGSFARSSFKNIGLAGPIIILGILMIWMHGYSLNILSLSEDEAESLGIDVKKTRLRLILASTMITASSISLCGQIGFIGLIIPHMARMMVGANTKYLLPVTLSLGMSFMVIIEALSRTMSVVELPISILTAIIGASIFIRLIRTSGGVFR